jgi:hypothetical protein
MKFIKKIIKFFFQKIYTFYLDLRDLYSFQLNKRKRINYPGLNKKNNKALIFGNGPSLKNILKKNFELDKADIFVCNGFAIADNYEILRPINYVLLDPAYFDFENKFVKERLNNVIETWDAILLKTTWDMTLYTSVSDDASLKVIKKKITKNITWINIFPLHFYGRKMYYYLLDGLGLLGGQSVTHFSLQIAILKRYKEVYLCGVDLDWVENIKYDESNNKVFLLNKHFYDETKLYYGEAGLYQDASLIQEFNSLNKTFKSFKELYDFSKYLNVEVFRATKSFLHFIPFKQYSNNSD